MSKLQIIIVNKFYVIKSLNHIFLGNLFNKYNLNYKEFFEYCEEKYKISTEWNEPWFYSKKDALEVIEYIESLMIMAKLTNDIKEVENNKSGNSTIETYL